MLTDPQQSVDMSKFFDLSDCSASADQLAQLTHVLNGFSDVIAQNDSEIGCTTTMNHTIDVGNSRPINQAPRRLAPTKANEVRKHVQDMLDSDVVEPSNSPWSSPVVLVAKSDGSTRFCVDYRKLNAVTLKDAHPLPRIDDTLDHVWGANFFSTLDLQSGYWQVPMDEDSKEKTAFSAPDGLFQFTRMPFGLTNAPATFQRLMNATLRGLTFDACLMYLDDVIIFSRTFKEHLDRFRKVLLALRCADLKLKPRKCKLLRQSVPYLGFLVSSQGIAAYPEKFAPRFIFYFFLLGTLFAGSPPPPLLRESGFSLVSPAIIAVSLNAMLKKLPLLLH